MDNSHLSELIKEQQNLAKFRARTFLVDSTGKNLPQRIIYPKLYSYFDDFMDSHNNPRFILLSGARGTGKTTLLFQLFNQIQSIDCYTLFLSLDRTYGDLGISLQDLLTSYEGLLGMALEKLDKPLVIFIDETQFDPTGLNVLQHLLDSSDNIFIFLAGSTTLNPILDSDKRFIHEIIYPVSSPEYTKITKQKFQIPGLGDSIRDAILYSTDSEALYVALQHIAPEVNTYYKGSLQSDFFRYFCYGSLPYLLSYVDESEVYEQIQRSIDRILIKDLPVFRFHPETVSMIPNMLFELAHMDHCNVKRMAEKFGFSRSKMSEVLDALESVDLLRRIYPHGPYANEVISRKPSKYLFSIPIFRVNYLRLLSDIVSNEPAKNKITEDFVAMYLQQVFDTIGKGTLMYDSNHDGADFVLTVDEVSIIIHIGTGGDGPKKVAQSRKKIPSKYGVIITENQLDYDPESGIIRIPLRMFLLM